MPHASAYLCVSHLPWDTAWQRPQHLLSRFARDRRVYYVEPPVTDEREVSLHHGHTDHGVHILTPHLPGDLPADAQDTLLHALLADLVTRQDLQDWGLWCTHARAAGPTRGLTPLLTIYDYTHPTEEREAEEDLLARADVVFTGSPTLHESLRYRHPYVYLFPDAVDPDHFRPARALRSPGGSGRAGILVWDEEMVDWEMVEALSLAGMNLTVVGPVHRPLPPWVEYRGEVGYDDLPAVLARWDLGLMPLRRDKDTRSLCPADPLLLLAAGLPVIAAPLPDLMIRYRPDNLVRFAATLEQYLEEAVAVQTEDAVRRLRSADRLLAGVSWDHTWKAMGAIMAQSAEEKRVRHREDASSGTELALQGA